ncbi:hypothetical protein E5F05_02965 (plasmid) [Deinococcus metallilatus]|uniref:Heme-degrading monooxygenase HmoA n=1 Tax=Deinococcus metallilatus TaxID=1211322 RepID=A0AAJ5F8D6_9DEIO|nr:antibiotic biosynthesis monooxygenase [Deinococcus metallilatus]MBB5295636.1 heme-degrading monooxygenase HmoA [Deinococcus metallilatus]QBY06903.1 hypothetical protein E5F05_02965 [Deinococcus metallilatus]TLK32293.1 hypothetical protein FCS05_02300 [Deinococcus metallilatus]GMA14165.1 hypothetical protein GCM10025871_04960 [Deinococcus metallilatus]
MHARVVTVQIRPGKMSGAVLIYRDAVLPLLERQKGFSGARLLTDLSTGRGLLLTLWESEADMRAVEASGVFQEEIARFQPVLGAPPSRDYYEVSVSSQAGRWA